MKKIYYGRAVYNYKEINAVIKVLKNESLTLIDGHKVKLLEKKNDIDVYEDIIDIPEIMENFINTK